MATAARIQKRYTYEDFCALVKDGDKADLIDGVIYMASPDNTDANDINVWVVSLVFDFAEYFDLGKVYVSRVACRLDEFNAPEPDILFVPKKWRRKILRGRIDGAPALAVEIVSPDSKDRDYTKKRLQYERFRIQEYWIIDEMKRTATFLRLGKDGKYREVTPRGGIFRSKVLRGFWLSLEWLWPEKRPLKVHALATLIRSMKKNRGPQHGKK
jgi:Uma2 family endonuclease